jgi:hypothetical protein
MRQLFLTIGVLGRAFRRDLGASFGVGLEQVLLSGPARRVGASRERQKCKQTDA